MNEFTSSFWPIYISVLTLGGILACLFLLWFSAKTKVQSSADGTTGHVYDVDIREMNNPMPRWWMILFVITCVFAFGYLALYPGLGTYEGALKWTQIKQFEQEVERGNAQVAPVYAAFAGLSTEELSKNGEAMAIGDRLFMNNCAQCHGSDARGSKGFPNLTDKDWLWGGQPENIRETIINGRVGMMPPQAAAVGGADDVRNLAHYVLSLSGAPHDSLRAGMGQPKFAVCAACHGADGTGNQALGAPNLTNNVWLHGPGVVGHVIDMINNGKTSEMPPWGHKFTDEQLEVLTAYVWGLGGGEPESN